MSTSANAKSACALPSALGAVKSSRNSSGKVSSCASQAASQVGPSQPRPRVFLSSCFTASPLRTSQPYPQLFSWSWLSRQPPPSSLPSAPRGRNPCKSCAKNNRAGGIAYAQCQRFPSNSLSGILAAADINRKTFRELSTCYRNASKTPPPRCKMKIENHADGSFEKRLSRRKFVGQGAAMAMTFSIVPRHVLGGPGFVPPSDKVNIAFIGVGSQGLRGMLHFLKEPDVQGVAVCDPNKGSADYPQRGTHEFCKSVRDLLGVDTGWDWLSPDQPIQLTHSLRVTSGVAGREPCQQIVNAYYGAQKTSGKYSGGGA